jgi:hypothetical protein
MKREKKKRNERALRAVVHSRIMAKKQEVASAERLAAEGGIASDESAVAEPEVEANEGLAEEIDESAWQESGGESQESQSWLPDQDGRIR